MTCSLVEDSWGGDMAEISEAMGHDAWLAQVKEEIVDPDRPIIDSHHHLWQRDTGSYLLSDLWTDTASGHNIRMTVFVECRSGYRAQGPVHLRSVGETEFVVDIAEASGDGPGARVAAIVARADLKELDVLDDVLDAHVESGRGRFRGIRDSGARDERPEELTVPGGAAEGLYGDSDFRSGVRRLGERGFVYETWHYHHQNRDFVGLAQATPETVLVLDHFGTPLGVGRFAGRREEIFQTWQDDIASIAACENVVAKLGGLAMPDNGFGWHLRDRPPTSDEIVDANARYYRHTIECFGPERCMFESNFPVDRLSVSYHILFNAMKKIVADFSESEKQALFWETAARVYKLPVLSSRN
jgi:L-fuconolactonase